MSSNTNLTETNHGMFDKAGYLPVITGDIESSQSQHGDQNPNHAPADSNQQRWANIPLEMRERKQWCVAGYDKRPLTTSYTPASSTNPATWADFENVCNAASLKGLHVGYVLTKDDPFTCIDLDVKVNTPPEHIERFNQIIDAADSYTERSISGNGYHIWIQGKVSKGKKRDGVEIYSQDRFMVCTGSVFKHKPIEARQEFLDAILNEMGGDNQLTNLELEELSAIEPDDAIWMRARSAHNASKFIELCNGKWRDLNYPSQSEADNALLSMLCLYTSSNEQVRCMFRMTELGKRDKATQNDRYLNLTIQKIRSKRHAELEHGKEMALSLQRKVKAPDGFNLESFFEEHTLTKSEADKMLNQKFIVPNLIPQGSINVYPSPPNGGKTSIFTHLSDRMARGGYKVFYINADANPSQLKAQKDKAENSGFNILAPDAKDSGGVAGLLKTLHGLANLDVTLNQAVLILDTMKKFTDMLDKKQVKEFIALLRSLVAKGATVCLLGHTNKYADKDGKLIFEGVGDLRADVDNMIYLYSSLASETVREVTTAPDKTRAMFKPISFRINFSELGVEVEELQIVLPRLTDELRKTLNIAIAGIRDGYSQQEALVQYCSEETMQGVNKIREQLRMLFEMENAPLIRMRAPNGNGYVFNEANQVEIVHGGNLAFMLQQ